MLEFNDIEVIQLDNDGWQPVRGENSFFKLKIIPLSCGCCSDANTMIINKLSDHSFEVCEFEGCDQIFSEKFSTLYDAMDTF